MDGDNEPIYLPIHRVAQACVACRRKKSRCTGHRPACTQCRRLRQECVYSEPLNSVEIKAASPPGGDYEVIADSTSDVIIKRLVSIEKTMQDFAARLERFTNSVVQSSSPRPRPEFDTPVFEERQLKRKRSTGLFSGRNADGEVAMPSTTPEGCSISNDVLMSVVDAYFICAQNQPYSFFHEGNFRQRLAQNELADHLVLAVVASAFRFCRHLQLPADAHEMAVSYADKSWKSVLSNCFTTSKSPNISVVQTVALLALFDFTAGKSRHGAAWVKIGMAVRIAQDLGLMLEPPARLSYADQEERRRVFWSVYLLDRLVSCGRGRPPAIVDACCQLQLPCEDKMWREGLWQQTLTLDELANRASQSSQRQGLFAHVIVMAYTVGRSAQYMLQEFNIRSRYPPWDPSSDFAAIEADLMHLECQLELDRPLAEMLAPHISPEGEIDYQTTGPLIFSRALFHLCYCLLTHPFLLRRRLELGQISAPTSFLARVLDTGWYHAQKMVELFKEADNLRCTFRSSFSGYCVLITGSIGTLHAHDGDDSIRCKASNLVQEAILYLQDTGQYWRNVSTMALMLQKAAENTLVYSQLAARCSSVAPLSPEHASAMWALVDYSTISNETSANCTADGPPSANLWFESWIDLFGMHYNPGDFGTDGNVFHDTDPSHIRKICDL